MEQILDTYALPPDPTVPLVCFDEAGKELQTDVRDPAIRAGRTRSTGAVAAPTSSCSMPRTWAGARWR
jgi:hypothetical protein